MLGVSGLLGSSGDGAAAHEHGGSGGEMDGTAGPSRGGIFSEEEKGRVEEGDRSSAGNRWPRQETLALLKIRSDMDVAFRDSTVKGPLWEEVSRKLAELGYHRSAKKCKEKFENVYKYHKRTKEGRASKADGKNYPFFDQLEALENHPLHPSSKPQIPATAMPGTNPPPPPPPPPVVSQVVQETTTTKPFSQVLGVDSTVPSATNPITVTQNTVTPSSTINSTNLLPPPPPPTTTTITNPKRTYPSNAIRYSNPNVMLNSTSSSTSSDEEPRRRRLKRKRKWEDLLERVMKEVIQKQEELQRKFLEALEKRERDRMEREEAWRVQEMARMNREHDLLVQERSMAAAKDASLIAFLQKISQQQQNPNSSQMQAQVQPLPLPLPLPPPPSPPRQQPQPPPPPSPPTLDNRKTGETFVPNSSSRWPKVEVEALIRLRAELDLKYQENGPKGPLWEEMSMAMRKIGYDRSAKRCKEKWENINKYFKKVKESNKKRPEDSKTCPYFHQLDALYKEKNKNDTSLINHGLAMKPENDPMVPIMVQPEQQWPLPAPVMEDQARENIDQINDDGDMDDDDDDDEEEDGGGGYEIVTNKASSVATVERDKRERNENVDV